MKLNPTLVIVLGAVILSISAIVTVAMDNNAVMITGTPELEEILVNMTDRLNQQQAVITQNRGLIVNNTIFNQNQFNFNNDVIGWAGNTTAKIDVLATEIAK